MPLARRELLRASGDAQGEKGSVCTPSSGLCLEVGIVISASTREMNTSALHLSRLLESAVTNALCTSSVCEGCCGSCQWRCKAPLPAGCLHGEDINDFVRLHRLHTPAICLGQACRHLQ